jgi:hypothetical protein
MRAKARLEDLFVPRVDAVSSPANRRRFLLLKEVGEMPETLQEEEKKTQGLTADQQDRVKKALEILYPLFEEGVIPDVVIAILGKLVGYPLPEGVKPYPYPYPHPGAHPGSYPKPYGYPAPQETSCSTNTAPQEATKSEPNAAEVKQESVEKAEEASKPSAELEALQKAQAELEALRKALEEERLIREKKEYIETMKSQIPSLMSIAPEIADVLFTMKKSGDTRLEETFKKLEAVVSASPLFKELGSAGQVEESPWDIVEKQAQELLAKGVAKSIEAARVMVLYKNPDLYRQLRG